LPVLFKKHYIFYIPQVTKGRSCEKPHNNYALISN